MGWRRPAPSLARPDLLVRRLDDGDQVAQVQCSAGRSSRRKTFRCSRRVPLVDPAGIERQAEPEPSAPESTAPDRSDRVRRRRKRRRSARRRPRPTMRSRAHRDELREITRARMSIPARARTRSRCSETRRAAFSVVSTSRIVTWSASSAGSKITFVVVVAPSRFIEIEPLSGRRRAWSRRPQYLMKAILAQLRAVAAQGVGDVTAGRSRFQGARPAHAARCARSDLRLQPAQLRLRRACHPAPAR